MMSCEHPSSANMTSSYPIMFEKLKFINFNFGKMRSNQLMHGVTNAMFN